MHIVGIQHTLTDYEKRAGSLLASDISCDEQVLLASQTVKGCDESSGAFGILTGSGGYLEPTENLKQKQTTILKNYKTPAILKRTT